MRVLILIITFLNCSNLNAQISFGLKGVVTKSISTELKEGTNVELIQIFKDNLGVEKAMLKENGFARIVELYKLQSVDFKPETSNEFWQKEVLDKSVYNNFLRNGMQFKLRKELEDEALNYLNKIEESDLVFEDSYLESYLYSLIYKIYPNKLEDGRPGILNITIVKDPTPNAFIFCNGSMFINTGLLSTINSEEELLGILAHEISHFVLDHAVININKAIQRQKRAEFWSNLVVGLSIVADSYLSSRYEYYYPGTISMNTAILAYSIASSVNERMGLQFSREQETEADLCASNLMKFISKDPTALSSVLSKIKKYCIENGEHLALTGEGTHPAISERILKIGTPNTFNDSEYDKRISFVNTFNATLEFNNKHFTTCGELVKRNIKANVALEDDYILLAKSLTNMFDNEEKNFEALSYIKIAKSLNVIPNLNATKQEAIILIRLKKLNEAKNSLLTYKTELETLSKSIDKIKNERKWLSYNSYFENEYEWTLKMIHKVLLL
jgi:Zn-dependent protease with chaperone function